MDISLNVDELKEEIDFLKRTWRVKRSTPARSRPVDAVLSEKTDTRLSGSSEQRPESIRLLMEWVQAVCAFYSLKVGPPSCVARVFKSALLRIKKKGNVVLSKGS